MTDNKNGLLTSDFSGMAGGKWAEVAQCSRQYVSKLLTTLESAGQIKRNGHGVEILTLEG